MDDNLLTADELATRLGVKAGTVKRWGRDGWIPVIRLTPKIIRFSLENVINALTERTKRQAANKT